MAKVVGVAGGSGSGKSTIIRGLMQRLSDVSFFVLSMDDFYYDLAHLTPNQQEDHNYDHPNAIDHEHLLRVVERLLGGETVTLPRYDYATHSRVEGSKVVLDSEVLVVDGIFALYFDRLRVLMDHSIYVHVPDDLRLVRRLKRDVAERGRSFELTIDQYLKTVRPMHFQYVEPTKEHANTILNWEVENYEAAENVIKKVVAGK